MTAPVEALPRSRPWKDHRYADPAASQATADDVLAISDRLGLCISRDDAPEYAWLVTEQSRAYEAVAGWDPTGGTYTEDRSFTIPDDADNPQHAWSCRTEITPPVLTRPAGRSPGAPSPSRTQSRWRACPSGTAPTSATATSPTSTPRSSPVSWLPAPPSRARRAPSTCACPATRTRTTSRTRRTPGARAAPRAARPPALASSWRSPRRTWRSVPTRAAPSAARPPCAGSWGSSPPTGSCRTRGSRPARTASTTSGR